MRCDQTGADAGAVCDGAVLSSRRSSSPLSGVRGAFCCCSWEGGALGAGGDGRCGS